MINILNYENKQIIIRNVIRMPQERRMGLYNLVSRNRLCFNLSAPERRMILPLSDPRVQLLESIHHSIGERTVRQVGDAGLLLQHRDYPVLQFILKFISVYEGLDNIKFTELEAASLKAHEEEQKRRVRGGNI